VDRRTRNLFALALIVIIAITGGAALILGSPGPDGPPDTERIEGVVVEVVAVSLTDVRTFKLRTADGRVLDFELSELQNGVQFPPGHLAEHQATAQRVRVWYRGGIDSLLAIRLEDAP
jgi:hypothetical protein